MESFANIAITQSGMLIKILTPVLDQSKRPTGYMCEHTKGRRSFVASADLNYCDRSNLNCTAPHVKNNVMEFLKQD